MISEERERKLFLFIKVLEQVLHLSVECTHDVIMSGQYYII